jgi:hypothetical protein
MLQHDTKKEFFVIYVLPRIGEETVVACLARASRELKPHWENGQKNGRVVIFSGHGAFREKGSSVDRSASGYSVLAWRKKVEKARTSVVVATHDANQVVTRSEEGTGDQYVHEFAFPQEAINLYTARAWDKMLKSDFVTGQQLVDAMGGSMALEAFIKEASTAPRAEATQVTVPVVPPPRGGDEA